MPITRSLEFVTNLAVLAAAVTVIFYNVGPRPTPSPSGSPPYSLGDKIKETAELKFVGDTFLLATASSCRFCTESMPFYRRLVASGARVIAVTREPVEQNKAYLKSHDVAPAMVLSATANGLDVRGTPTLLLVDAQGVVRGTWRGKQDLKGEADVLSKRRSK